MKAEPPQANVTPFTAFPAPPFSPNPNAPYFPISTPSSFQRVVRTSLHPIRIRLLQTPQVLEPPLPPPQLNSPPLHINAQHISHPVQNVVKTTDLKVNKEQKIIKGTGCYACAHCRQQQFVIVASQPEVVQVVHNPPVMQAAPINFTPVVQAAPVIITTPVVQATPAPVKQPTHMIVRAHTQSIKNLPTLRTVIIPRAQSKYVQQTKVETAQLKKTQSQIPLNPTFTQSHNFIPQKPISTTPYRIVRPQPMAVQQVQQKQQFIPPVKKKALPRKEAAVQIEDIQAIPPVSKRQKTAPPVKIQSITLKSEGVFLPFKQFVPRNKVIQMFQDLEPLEIAQQRKVAQPKPATQQISRISPLGSLRFRKRIFQQSKVSELLDPASLSKIIIKQQPVKQQPAKVELARVQPVLEQPVFFKEETTYKKPPFRLQQVPSSKGYEERPRVQQVVEAKQQAKQQELYFFDHQAGNCAHCERNAKYVIYLGEEETNGLLFCKSCLQKIEKDDHDFTSCQTCAKGMAAHRLIDCKLCGQYVLKNKPENTVEHERVCHDGALCEACGLLGKSHMQEEHDLYKCNFCLGQWQHHRKVCRERIEDCDKCMQYMNNHINKGDHRYPCSFCKQHIPPELFMRLKASELFFEEYEVEDENSRRLTATSKVESWKAAFAKLDEAIDQSFEHSLGRTATGKEKAACFQQLAGQMSQPGFQIDLESLVQKVIDRKQG